MRGVNPVAIGLLRLLEFTVRPRRGPRPRPIGGAASASSGCSRVGANSSQTPTALRMIAYAAIPTPADAGIVMIHAQKILTLPASAGVGMAAYAIMRIA